jgi:hypothetical protein
MAVAWRSNGELPQGSANAEYVGKFCFDFVPIVRHGPLTPEQMHMQTVDDGVLSLHVKGELEEAEDPDKNSQLFFMIFDDEDDHWPVVRGNWEQLTCQDFKDAANAVVPLASRLASPQHELHQRIGVHEHVRPRFWYFAFINCGTPLPTTLTYSLHAWNPIRGYQAEFGIDQQNSLPLEIMYLLLFGGVFATVYVLYNLPCEWRSRPLLTALQASAACSCVSCCCLMLHNAAYARDGWGIGFLEIVGVISSCYGKALLAVLLYLLARGWTLLTSEAESSRRILFTAVFAGIVVLSVGCEIHGLYFHDQSTSLYLYESWPGAVILILNSFLLYTALHLLWETFQKEASEEVRSFYRLMAIANVFYFVSLFVICALAYLFDPWVRKKFVDRVELGSRFVTTLLLLFCLWPTFLEARIPARPARSGAEPLDFEEPAGEGEGSGLAQEDNE